MFGTQYKGTIEGENVTPKDDVGMYRGDLEKLIIAFAPPLYIGISTNLKQRLKTHVRQLQECIDKGYGDKVESLSRDNVDSEKESSYFGKRMAKALVDYELSKNGLYVRVVFSNKVEKLKPLESVLNSFFVPPYGRR